jgi:hydrogenase/urease accessory protein HupE
MNSRLITLMAAAPFPALAHDGHGTTTVAEHGLWHWLAEPDHLAVLVLGALATVWAVRALLRMRKDKARDR